MKTRRSNKSRPSEAPRRKDVKAKNARREQAATPVEKKRRLSQVVESIRGGFPRVVGPADALLTAGIITLIAFGVVMVYSASAVYAGRLHQNGQYFLIRQAVFAVAGIFGMISIARFDYHRYRMLTYPILFGALGLLVFVALFGHRAGGAARWIQLGPFNVQPAEIAKLAVILWLAYSLSKKSERIRSFSVGFLPHVLMAGLMMLLCLKQPDFGSAVMIGALTFIMLFTAGAKVSYLMAAAMSALPVAYALIVSSPYRMRRWRAFTEPFETRQNEGYQIFESLVSFGSGGATGLGIGDSRQKLFFLPEAHTDFISAIIGEELGFLGVAGLLFVFTFVVYRGLRAAWRAADDYGSYLAVGITMFIGLQAFTNLAVAMGMLPTKGLVLPFISYGGSSLLVNCAAVGILLNVSRPRDAELNMKEETRESGANASRGNGRVRPREVSLAGGTT